ncbi:MAG: bifunctional 2-polyprenyl-6-hydroxyphenol methylase/3-demethylubiquinol 3-O-methyltransferase UbiG [Alphaproteobacteria bacterium]|nr:bifunctional 2-polyprenyl-6-hydroxyphenol methylase/3-demethylubiquinol 3-O-methyltransferase UbiG [Alphaproteobacteria bacterium]
MRRTSSTIDPGEIACFAGQGEDWWDSEGSFRTLHRVNPVRLGFIRQHLAAHFCRDRSSLRPFDGLTLLDIGCGGGLVAEPMARLGFAVTGIDASTEAVDAARTHAEAMGLAIDYRVTAAESFAAAGRSFDTVLALEVIEHVADPADFFAAVSALVRPGGAFIGATLNRTPRSFALAILGAEYILRWLPPGTHHWRKFLRPSEFVLGMRRNGFVVTQLAGLTYDPQRAVWSLSPDLQVNYLVVAVRR